MLTSVLLVSCLIFVVNGDYYWREYVGTIPNDALVAGKDLNGKNVYIGQGFHGRGLIVAQINQGIKEVSMPIYGVKKTSIGTKILCTSDPNIFSWVPTTASQLHLLKKNTVIGGVEDGKYINVGRIFNQGATIIGKVNAFSVGNAKLYYVNDNGESLVDSYEVLVVDVDRNKIDVRMES